MDDRHLSHVANQRFVSASREPGRVVSVASGELYIPPALARSRAVGRFVAPPRPAPKVPRFGTVKGFGEQRGRG